MLNLNKKRRKTDEKNISAVYNQEEEQARLQRKNVNKERKKSTCQKKSCRQKKTDGERRDQKVNERFN